MPDATKPFDCLNCGEVFRSKGTPYNGNPFEQLCPPCRLLRRERTCTLCSGKFVAAGTTRKCMDCRKKNAKPCRDCGGEVVAGNRVYCLACECIRSQENRFNLPRGWYAEQLARQGGVCAICGQAERVVRPDGTFHLLTIDHDHSCCPGSKSCGKCVRQILCRTCNSALGLMKDSVDILVSATAYLIKHQANQVTSDEVVQADTLQKSVLLESLTSNREGESLA